MKNSFAYNKLIDLFENSIINPKGSFVFGNDFRVPMMHGLLSKNFVDKLKMSPSFNIESFQREYRLLYSINLLNCWENLYGLSAAKFYLLEKVQRLSFME